MTLTVSPEQQQVVQSFLAECCVTGPTAGSGLVLDIYDAYSEYADRQPGVVLDRGSFVKAMRSEGYDRWFSNSWRGNRFQNVTLKPNAIESITSMNATDHVSSQSIAFVASRSPCWNRGRGSVDPVAGYIRTSLLNSPEEPAVLSRDSVSSPVDLHDLQGPNDRPTLGDSVRAVTREIEAVYRDANVDLLQPLVRLVHEADLLKADGADLGDLYAAADFAREAIWKRTRGAR